MPGDCFDLYEHTGRGCKSGKCILDQHSKTSYDHRCQGWKCLSSPNTCSVFKPITHPIPEEQKSRKKQRRCCSLVRRTSGCDFYDPCLHGQSETRRKLPFLVCQNPLPLIWEMEGEQLFRTFCSNWSWVASSCLASYWFMFLCEPGLKCVPLFFWFPLWIDSSSFPCGVWGGHPRAAVSSWEGLAKPPAKFVWIQFTSEMHHNLLNEG